MTTPSGSSDPALDRNNARVIARLTTQATTKAGVVSGFASAVIAAGAAVGATALAAAHSEHQQQQLINAQATQRRDEFVRSRRQSAYTGFSTVLNELISQDELTYNSLVAGIPVAQPKVDSRTCALSTPSSLKPIAHSRSSDRPR